MLNEVVGQQYDQYYDEASLRKVTVNHMVWHNMGSSMVDNIATKKKEQTYKNNIISEMVR